MGTTNDQGLIYGDLLKDPTLLANLIELIAYSNSNFIGDRNNRKLIGAYIFLLNRALILQYTKRQSTIATLSIEAKYITLYQTTKEALQIRKIIKDIGQFTGGKCITIRVDNLLVKQLTKINEYKARTKYINV